MSQFLYIVIYIITLHTRRCFLRKGHSANKSCSANPQGSFLGDPAERAVGLAVIPETRLLNRKW